MTDGTRPDPMRARLRRIEGQVRGIARMLDDDRSCEEVVTQLMAIRSGIDTVGALVLDDHLGNCLPGDDPTDQVDALRDYSLLHGGGAEDARLPHRDQGGALRVAQVVGLDDDGTELVLAPSLRAVPLRVRRQLRPLPPPNGDRAAP